MINQEVKEKIQKQLELRQQEALLVYSPGTLDMLQPGHLFYVTWVRPAGASAAIVTCDGRARFLVQPPWDAARAASRTWIEDVRPTDNLACDLSAAVRELCPSGRLLGAGLASMPHDLYSALEVCVSPGPGNELVEHIAREKSPSERDAVRELARIADLGFQAMLKYGQPGIREFELQAYIEEAMLAEGAEDNFILASGGPHSHEMHEPTDRRFAAGDLILGEISAGKDGQIVQLCRTIVLGEPTAQLRSKYSLLMEALEAALAEVRPGVPAGNMPQAMNRIIADAGYGKFCYPPYMRARGHGFGCGSIAPGGAIDEHTTHCFQPDQVVVIHPNQYFEDTGYLACGETVLVDGSSFERLANTETRLYIAAV